MHPDKFLKRAALQRPRLSDAERGERMEVLGTVIAAKRKEAVDARKNSGIESVWLTCEESYLGIDDANRHEFSGARWAKPTSMSGPLTANTVKDDSRSTAFVRLTSRYVDFGAAKLGEILLPIDDKAFSFTATPDADLIAQIDNQTPVTDPAGNAVMHQPAPIEGVPGQPGPQPLTVGDQAAATAKQAPESAEKAEKRIYDWMVESKYPAEARKVLQDAARLGVGVLKGPFPEMRESKAVTKAEGGIALQVLRKVAPAMRWIDPWNFFPHEGCGEDIHSGEEVLERDFLSTKALKKLKAQPGYLADQIDKVLEEGPGKVFADGSNPTDKHNKKRYEIWYYYGSIKREDFEIAGDPELLKGIPQDQEDVYAIVSLVNDTVIRAVLNPSDSGSFPYRVMTWSRRPGHWAGVGVGEQISMPQRMVNASTRALLNNAGVSAGVQIILDQLGVTPADGSWKITPNKVWYKTAESTSDDVRKAFAVLTIPSVQAQLSAIIDYGMKLSEEQSGIPLVAQGQDGQTTPQTFGQAELQNTNAHTWLRSVGYRYDDSITEPLVDDLYEWLINDPNVPDDEKGDFQINAHGSIAMIEKAIQEQTYAQMLPATLNPAYGQDPAKFFAELMKAKRMNPLLTAYTDEQKKAMQSQPPPEAPQVTVAKIKASTDIHRQDMADQAELQRIAAEAQHEQNALVAGGSTPHEAAAMARIEQERIRAVTAERVESSRANAEQSRADKELLIAQQNGNLKLQELAAQERILLLEYANKRGLKLDEVKAELARSAMDNQTKRELAAAEIELAHSEGDKNRAVDLHKHNNPPPSLVRDEVATDATP